MRTTSLITNITSSDPDRLDAFYAEVVGLERAEQYDLFKVGDGLFFIDGHSDTAGPTAEPSRVIVSFWVDDVAAEEARLVAAGVPCIRSQGREFWGGIISTFVDPDGNYFQLMGDDEPSPAPDPGQ